MRAKKSFVVIFLILIVLPMLLFDSKTAISKAENRALAMLPEVIKNNTLNSSLFAEIDTYLQDRFGLRRNLLTLNRKFDNLKITSKGAKAIQGKQGWLFYVDKNDGDNLQDFLKKNLVSSREAVIFAKNIKDRAEWCELNGIKFVFLIAPNKHTIYPEFYPLDAPAGISRTEQLTKAMDELNVKYIYPKELLLKSKQENNIPLYYRLGTHWNDLGAYITYQQALLPAIKRELGYDNIADIEFEYTMQMQLGGDRDLPPMLDFKDNSKQPVITFKPKGQEWSALYTREQADIDERNGVISINSSSKLPKAIVFRDSFFGSLLPFTATNFSRVEYKWKFFEQVDKEYVLQNKPDIIIFEVAERNLYNIINIDFK